MLPQRKKPLRSGICRAPRREWPKHRAWVRKHECVVTLSEFATSSPCYGPIEFSHIRTAANAGTSIKPHDASGVPMCAQHHHDYHGQGHQTFSAKFRLDLAKLAAEFAAKSTDTLMRESLR